MKKSIATQSGRKIHLICADRAALPQIIAHRGASRAAAENTLDAFARAWREGADGIEGDFHLSADGQVICIHDADTLRVAGTRRIVRDETAAALQRLTLHGGTTIPTLAQVLAAMPAGKHIEIEIKCGEEIIPPLLADIARSGIGAAHTTFISFNAAVIRALKSHAPRRRALWLAEFTGAYATPPATLWQTLKSCNADGLGSCPNIPRPLARALLTRSYRWHVWTVNDGATARRLRDWGAHSLTTNTPARLRQTLRRR